MFGQCVAYEGKLVVIVQSSLTRDLMRRWTQWGEDAADGKDTCNRCKERFTVSLSCLFLTKAPSSPNLLTTSHYLLLDVTPFINLWLFQFSIRFYNALKEQPLCGNMLSSKWSPWFAIKAIPQLVSKLMLILMDVYIRFFLNTRRSNSFFCYHFTASFSFSFPFIASLDCRRLFGRRLHRLVSLVGSFLALGWSLVLTWHDKGSLLNPTAHLFSFLPLLYLQIIFPSSSVIEALFEMWSNHGKWLASRQKIDHLSVHRL